MKNSIYEHKYKKYKSKYYYSKKNTNCRSNLQYGSNDQNITPIKRYK